MREKLIQQFQDNLLNIYDSSFLKNCSYQYILVLKDLKEPYVDQNILYTHYHDFYSHDYLKYPIPAIRKPHKLQTYQQGIDLLKKINYGTLCITSNIPYMVSLNHWIVDNHIYFHCGQDGYKLKGVNQLACYQVVEDLGIHQEAFTNNHQSVIVYGFLKEVKDHKKALLNAFMERYTPGLTKDLNQSILDKTTILELSIEHMSVKKHFH